DYDATPDFVVKLKKTLESPFFYNTEGPTLNYDDGGPELFNLLMRSSVTKLGCVWVTCSADFNFYGLMTFYCLTNQSPPGLKDPIYEVGTGVCSGCPQGTFCEAGSKLCARTLSAPPGERIFKGFKCRNSLIAEEWRRKMLNVHNDNRRKLAKGSQRGEGGAPLPTAKNMNQLIWDCSLEDVAYEQAVKCTESVTPPAGYGAVSSMIWTKAKPCNAWNKTVQAVKDIWRAGSTKQASHKKVAGNDDFSQTYDCGIEELIMGGLIDCAGKPVATKRLQTYSFYVFKPYNAPVEEALQKVIERWWSPLAEKGIPDNKYHEGEELENYVNTRKVGCGISACYRKGWIEIQCGYGMDEYIDDGDDIYEAGKTCRNCAKLKPAMRCSRLGGLCVPWGRSLF
ncbi:SCP-like protein, partial [Ancylostoma ceylanicum]